jgi:hypothetical protein
VITYKFLSSGAIGLFSRHRWPTPSGTAPGEWVRVDHGIQQCLHGIHACSEEHLVEWLDDELWQIELADPVLEADRELVAPAGRLLRRLDAWNDESARAFTRHCVDNTVALAAESLAQAGRANEARTLAASRSRQDAERRVLQLARFEDDQTSPVLFVADVARLERGGRPELDKKAPTADAGGPTAAALAANLAYVCAHIAARLAERENAGAYDESFARERRGQSTWLAENVLRR